VQVGQKVLLIATWPEYDCVPPPIGAVGEITELMDEDGDYFVLFPDHPCPHGEPDWYVPPWAIIPINDPDAPAAVTDESELSSVI
jgi:hypothetical protein